MGFLRLIPAECWFYFCSSVDFRPSFSDGCDPMSPRQKLSPLEYGLLGYGI